MTTYITNLSLTDSWKGTTRQFLSYFKEKLRLLDSLVPDTDKIPETVRITFLQRAVQQNHDLRQIHVLDSVWRSKTGSTGKFTFEVYYDLFWNAAYQHDLNKTTKQTQRKIFISHQNDPCDDSEHDPEEEDLTIDHNQDEPSPYSVFQSFFNSSAPKKPTKVLIPYQLWGELPEAAKKMMIEYNKKIKVVRPKPHLNGGKSNPNATLGKCGSNPQQVHLYEKDDLTENQPPESTIQTTVHECLTECGTDPSDIYNDMSIFNAKDDIPSQDSSEKDSSASKICLCQSQSIYQSFN